ncbi:hypothetical protein [Nocardia cerradoensis]|uniref:Uncharacterized protein n=1 Tax=Nocardia cerradoensis TaxID=85688 RepID=A0A231GVK8_9NOCA|nr:hypothetical protein [Nocardia cerradoensis]NKY48379.1 hypothetical protein [Nocardia cerradoensis]OXR40653.1 hypothetical protein B7C42_07210 [Nocardia cerradoensis]
MRIIRDDDGHDQNDDNPRKRLEDIAAGVPADEVGNMIADEVSDFLAAAVRATDRTPAAPAEPSPAQHKPDLRLVPSVVDDEENTTEKVGTTGSSGRVRLLTSTAASSSLVVTAAALAGWGQPAVVAVPVAGYGIGWLAYLWWNAALRPPLPVAVAAIATALARGSAAFARALVGAVKWLTSRATAARFRHDDTATATAEVAK